jgi:hypothetical protein
VLCSAGSEAALGYWMSLSEPRDIRGRKLGSPLLSLLSDVRMGNPILPTDSGKDTPPSEDVEFPTDFGIFPSSGEGSLLDLEP